MQENITAQSAILNICRTETVYKENIKTMHFTKVKHRIISILLIISTVILQYNKDYSKLIKCESRNKYCINFRGRL